MVKIGLSESLFKRIPNEKMSRVIALLLPVFDWEGIAASHSLVGVHCFTRAMHVVYTECAPGKHSLQMSDEPFSVVRVV